MTHPRGPLGSPPGYAASSRPNGTVAVALELFVSTASLLLALDQLLIVQPDLYSHTGVGPSKALARLVLLGCGLIGWRAAATASTPCEDHPPRAQHRYGLRCRFTGAAAMLLGSVGLAISGLAHFWAFDRGSLVTGAAILPSALALFGIGGGVQRLPTSLPTRLGSERIAQVLLNPFIAVGMLAGLCTAAVLSNSIGPIRSSFCIAGGLAAAAALSTGGRGTEQAHTLAFVATTQRSVSFALLVTYAICATVTERFVPLRRVVTSSHPIVFLARSDRCTLEVTSGQGAYHLFVDDELRFSTFDEKRWAEALVKPALARVRQPRRALVLSTGEGLIERELLKDPGIESITSVTRCGLVPRLARRGAWLRLLSRDAMNSPRVSVVELDPAAFLVSRDQTPYDLVIVDLPDPAGPLASKYYCRYFYQLLAAHLWDWSIVVVQATSARRSPRTFATIGATMRAVGFSVQPLVVPLISRGEWNLYLLAKGRIPEPMRPHFLADSLAAAIPEQFSHPWPDSSAPAGFVAEPSTLHDSKVLDWFERESGSDRD
jgi:predicted membrane-bound spermidine synthase